MEGTELKAWLILIRAPGVGPGAIARLLEAYGGAQAALDAGPAGWRAAGLAESLHQGLKAPATEGLEQDLAWLAAPGCELITLSDPRYPPRLREVAAPPPALFCQGDPEIASRPQLAIVGSRNATAQGEENARAFAAELARCGLAITSGLALGIDGAAHRGALEADGLTIAVCATGLDRVYPARHRELAHAIASRGLLLSEFPTGTPALAEHFPRRNRIISGLALGVLVVEAAERSGSLITARLAATQGREVFALPGSIHNPLARGCHALIRQGAKLVETAADVLEELAPLLGTLRPHDPPSAPESGPADLEAARILEALGYDAAPLDALVERLGWPVQRLSAALLKLELEGRVASLPGGVFMRVQRGSVD